MCVAAAAIPMIVSAAAATVKAVGDYSSAQSEARGLQRDATINDRQTAEEEARIRYRNEFVLSEATQDVSGSGLTASGSTLTTLRENAKRLELEALDTRYQGQLTSAKLRNNAQALKRQSYVSLAGGLLGSAAEVLKGPGLFDTGGAQAPKMTLGGTTKSQARIGGRTMGPVY
jgi:hypothetical protein